MSIKEINELVKKEEKLTKLFNCKFGTPKEKKFDKLILEPLVSDVEDCWRLRFFKEGIKIKEQLLS
jgi:hypothetical protein